MNNNEININEQNINDDIDKNGKKKMDKYKRSKIILISVAVGLILAKILVTVLAPQLAKKEYNNIIEELKDMDDKELYNFGQMQRAVNQASEYTNVDEFYDNDIIKMVEYLQGKWKVSKIDIAGEGNSIIRQCDIEFSKGRYLQTIEAVREEYEYDWDLYYQEGVLYCGSPASENGYEMITEYDGVGDDSIVIKRSFGGADDEIKEWLFYCEKITQ